MVVILVSAVAFTSITLSPWVTETFAKNRMTAMFEKQARHVSDGCGINCDHCGVSHSEKVLYGRQVEIKYSCGLVPDSPEYVRSQSFFVSFFGTVH